MQKVQTQVWKSDRLPKLTAGPTSPSPGPMLLTQASTAVKAVTTSMPLKSRTMVMPTSVAPYIIMKAITFCMTRVCTACPPITTGATTLGCTMRTSSRCDCLSSSSMRTILMPPPVEPAQVAKHPSRIINSGAKIGHWA